MIIQIVKFIHNYGEHVQKPDAFHLAYQACGDHLPCTYMSDVYFNKFVSYCRFLIINTN